ncbi:GAF domain-containing protein [Vibrio sp.]|uniref:GAF domain-containing protein n=1 Tax=Vibrio sp. TaxID=678 RepID=UPI003D0C4A16
MSKQNIRQMVKGYQSNGVAWLETSVVTLIVIYIWTQSQLLVPPIVEQNFFWPLIGPLLVALRYGLAKGLTCAVVTNIAIAYIMQLDGNLQFFPLSHGIGMVFTAMLAGEFQNHWNNTNRRLSIEHQYMRDKLAIFTKNYHLLKVSHDQLEQRTAGQSSSLRSSIKALRNIATRHTDHRQEYLAEPILNLMAEIGGIEVAGFYQVNGGNIAPTAAVVRGEQHLLDRTDPMLQEMMEEQQLLSVAKLSEQQEHKSRYQLCIPLVNTHGETQAAVLAESTKFFMLNPTNIALLSVIANYSADLLSDEIIAPTLQQNQRSLFIDYLGRARNNNKNYGTDSSLIVCIDIKNKHQRALNSAIERHRGADIYWSCQTVNGQPALAVLLPMTTLYGAQQFANRLTEVIPVEIPSVNANFKIIGPLSVERDWDKIQQVMVQLGAFYENMAAS